MQFSGQQQTATADTAGKWMITLKPLPVNTIPQSLTVTCGDSSVAFSNILVGMYGSAAAKAIWNTRWTVSKKICSASKGMDEGEGLTETKPAAIRYGT